jgi:hypothetical protein
MTTTSVATLEGLQGMPTTIQKLYLSKHNLLVPLRWVVYFADKTSLVVDFGLGIISVVVCLELGCHVWVTVQFPTRASSIIPFAAIQLIANIELLGSKVVMMYSH